MNAQWKPTQGKGPDGILLGMVIGALLVVAVAVWIYFQF